VPTASADSDPPQPDGFVAARFQVTLRTWGTPRVNRTARSPASLHAAESHTTWPCLVTTTCTEPGPYWSVQAALAVETAYTLNSGLAVAA